MTQTLREIVYPAVLDLLKRSHPGALTRPEIAKALLPLFPDIGPELASILQEAVDAHHCFRIQAAMFGPPHYRLMPKGFKVLAAQNGP